MAIDRSKFKKTSASQLAQADKELNKTMGKRDRSNGNGHEVEDGINLFRIYPVHPDIAEKDPKAVFAVPFVQTFLPAMVKEKDKDGKEILEGGKPKMKLSVRPVYNSKVHGGTPKDLVEEYIKLAGQNAKDLNLNEADRKEYMKPIYGAFSKDPKKNINGINYPQAWIVYADKYPSGNPAATPSFDEWRFKKSIKERLNKISAIEAASDPLGTDPFTDIEEGKGVKVIYDPNSETPQGYYTTELDNSSVTELIGNRTVKVQKTYPLSDTQLENFLSAEPLQTKYGKKLATRKNFEAQLTGLEMFDNKWNMGIFDLAVWNEIVAECDGYYPEQDAATDTQDDASTTVDTTEDVVEDSGDEFDLMDRKELQQFAKDNKTGILVRPALSDEDLKNKLREWKKSATIEEVPLPNETVSEENEVEQVVADTSTKKTETAEEKQKFLDDLNGVNKPDTSKMSAKERLDFLRKQKKAA